MTPDQQERRKAHIAARNAARRAQGLCRCGRPPAPDRKLCAHCVGIPSSAAARRRLYGERLCAVPSCGKRFVPSNRANATNPQATCSKSCARKLPALHGRCPFQRADVRAKASERAKVNSRLRRMRQVAAMVGQPTITDRDYEMFRIGWRMALDTQRGRVAAKIREVAAREQAAAKLQTEFERRSAALTAIAPPAETRPRRQAPPRQVIVTGTIQPRGSVAQQFLGRVIAPRHGVAG